ncbi:hypothetical protein PU560_15010 [Georgenia sp. 10Sc9-8]|uniref:WXG100 family type VII secretion target n=1 Tax=Georgenia halotolerans TaxID=3028317 RepID=A0ABT5U0I9_9MICO|nr:hypothetical protein [Georgenia halotolerans]
MVEPAVLGLQDGTGAYLLGLARQAAADAGRTIAGAVTQRWEGSAGADYDREVRALAGAVGQLEADLVAAGELARRVAGAHHAALQGRG